MWGQYKYSINEHLRPEAEWKKQRKDGWQHSSEVGQEAQVSCETSFCVFIRLSFGFFFHWVPLIGMSALILACMSCDSVEDEHWDRGETHFLYIHKVMIHINVYMWIYILKVYIYMKSMYI